MPHILSDEAFSGLPEQSAGPRQEQIREVGSAVVREVLAEQVASSRGVSASITDRGDQGVWHRLKTPHGVSEKLIPHDEVPQAIAGFHSARYL